MIFAGGVVNPPVSFADSPLYTRGAFGRAKFVGLLTETDMHILLFTQLGFDIFNGTGNPGGEVLAPILGDKAVILQTEADPPFLVIDAHIHAEYHPRFDHLRGLYRVVYIKANVVGTHVPPIGSHLVHRMHLTDFHKTLGIVTTGGGIHLRHFHSVNDDGEHIV